MIKRGANKITAANAGISPRFILDTLGPASQSSNVRSDASR